MRIFWRIIALLVLIAAILGIGFYAYNIGMAQGVAQNVTSPAGGSMPVPYMQYWPHHFGFAYGFGFLGCLIPLFLLFLVFGSMRALFWHGPMGWRHHMYRGPWGWRHGEDNEKDKDVPPFFEEWHRRAHGEAEDKSVKS